MLVSERLQAREHFWPPKLPACHRVTDWCLIFMTLSACGLADVVGIGSILSVRLSMSEVCECALPVQLGRISRTWLMGALLVSSRCAQRKVPR